MNLGNGNGTVAKNATASAEQEIKRYLRLVSKRKWWILMTFIVVFGAWTAYVITYQSRPKYTATALLTFQDPQKFSAVAGKTSINLGIASLITSNSLLGSVVETLNMNVGIVTKDVYRRNLFKYLDSNSKSKPGVYKVVILNNKYDLIYYNKEMDIPETKLLSFTDQDTVQINDLNFQINGDYLKSKQLKEVEFEVREFTNAIQNLRLKVSYKYGRQGRILNVSAISKSPVGAAKIVNTLIDKYDELILNMKRYQTDKVLETLEDELNLAKQELDQANEKLKNFREKYPWVTLNPKTTSVISEITSYEQQKNELKTKIDDLNNLIAKVRKSQNIDDQMIIIREVLTYLGTAGMPVVTAYEKQFNDLSLQRSLLLNDYAPTHPFVVQNEQEFAKLIDKILQVSNEYITNLENQTGEIVQNEEFEKYKLKRLPVKEIELSELIRDRDIKSDLYKGILTRYNRSKIEREVEVSDVLIIDRAVPPPEISAIENLIKKLLMGVFLSLGLGFGLAFVFEFFNKTVENVEDLQEKIELPVIGSIPFIENENEDSEDFRALKGRRDPRLITLDYSPTLESESYRDLRTKILYMNQSKKSSSFLITSLQPNEGKSLTSSNLAITLAQQKITTILIDGDLRRGVLHNVFGNKKKPGLSDFLISRATVDYNNLNKLIQTTFIPNLFLITAGSPLPNPTEMLGSDRMTQVINLLKSKFGMVLIDTTPIQASSDAVILATMLEGALIVVRANSTNIEQLNKKINEYRALHDKLLGVILNMVKKDTKKQQYQYSYYNY